MATSGMKAHRQDKCFEVDVYIAQLETQLKATREALEPFTKLMWSGRDRIDDIRRAKEVYEDEWEAMLPQEIRDLK